MTEDLYERVAVLEVKAEKQSKLVDKNTTRIEKLEEKNDVLIEMKTLMSMQMEVNSEQKEQIKEFGITLSKVNDNLTQLNVSQQQMKTDMSEIGNRVSDIEKNQEESKIDPLKLVKNGIGYVFSILGGILVAYLYMKLGLK